MGAVLSVGVLGEHQGARDCSTALFDPRGRMSPRPSTSPSTWADADAVARSGPTNRPDDSTSSTTLRRRDPLPDITLVTANGAGFAVTPRAHADVEP